jgi:predicted hotdog family 3-hydroxylacyl-ACP dehydratase
MTPDLHLLPHGPAMRLVDQIDSLEEDRIFCSCKFPAGFPWAGPAVLPAYLALEGMAQAAGLLAASSTPVHPSRAHHETSPAQGYIARIREAELSPHGMSASEPWEVTAQVVGRSGKLLLFRGVATQAGETLLEARFALYLDGPGQSG